MAARMASWHEGGYSFGLAFRSSKAEVWCFAKGKTFRAASGPKSSCWRILKSFCCVYLEVSYIDPGNWVPVSSPLKPKFRSF